MLKTRITQLFGIEYPIIQAGMVWCSGWKLASAVSNAGGLGIIGAGSMSAELLKEHITKFKQASTKPFAVNLPLIYKDIDKQIEVILEQKVKIVFTSAGNPNLWTPLLKKADITVVHVVSSTKFALKAQESGCDAVVAEGFEAGGHNGREETTTLCLLPLVVDALKIPVIVAGGIASGRAMLAAMVLGAEAVQIGTLFASCAESSAHEHYKQAILNAKEGDTQLCLKKIVPVRMLKNEFYQLVQEMESKCWDAEAMKHHIGKGRSKKGIHEGDINQGELEMGQIASQINQIYTAKEIIAKLVGEYELSKQKILLQKLN
jgi:enoyl-[acyl-carrier protein] reductase II